MNVANHLSKQLHSPPDSRIPLFGPIIQGDFITFQLWAPDANTVGVVIEGVSTVDMAPNEAGVWRASVRAGVGARYQFIVDGVNVPDPASRFQPGDVDGPSQVIDSSTYIWRHTEWIGRPWEETVLYELHVGALGGYAGVRACLPQIAKLGVTAVELMPIADFAGVRNWGYDGALPFAPDSAYGSPDDLRELIDQAHGLGLMVFIDVVYNHFGPKGNYLSLYAAEFFDSADPTPWGSAIDFCNPMVRRFYIENALYWLETFRFDGLRLDAVHAIKSQDWLEELSATVRSRFEGRHVHLVLENENNDATLLLSGFNAQWNDDFHNVMHVLLTGETHSYYMDFADTPSHLLARCLAQGFIYQGEPSASKGGVRRGQRSGHLAPMSFVAFLQNHDQIGNRAFGERLTTLANKSALQAAMALLLLSPQIPMLFMGEEYGTTTPFLFFTDFQGELGAAVSEGRRREFAAIPGFTGGGTQRAIPDPNARSTFEASRPNSDERNAAEWYTFIQELLTLRRNHIIPFLNGAYAAGAKAIGDRSVVASWQLANETALVLAINLTDAAVSLELPNSDPIFGTIPRVDELNALSTAAWIIS